LEERLELGGNAARYVTSLVTPVRIPDADRVGVMRVIGFWDEHNELAWSEGIVLESLSVELDTSDAHNEQAELTKPWVTATDSLATVVTQPEAAGNSALALFVHPGTGGGKMDQQAVAWTAGTLRDLHHDLDGTARM
jgi:hypothetical protein